MRLPDRSDPGLTVIDLASSPLDCELPVFPEIVNLAGGEEVYIHNHDDLNPIGRYTTPYPIDEQTILVSHAPFCKLGPHEYGVYLFDLESRRQTLIYDDPASSEVDVVALAQSPAPPIPRLADSGIIRQSSADASAEPTGEYVILSVFNSDLPFDRRAVKFLRVTAAEQLGNVMNANGLAGAISWGLYFTGSGNTYRGNTAQGNPGPPPLCPGFPATTDFCDATGGFNTSPFNQPPTLLGDNLMPGLL